MKAKQSNHHFADLKPGDPWPKGGLERVECCPICASAKRLLLYDNLQDQVFLCAPGTWTLYQCGGCSSAYLDPRPTRETIWLAYRSYFTHTIEKHHYESYGWLKQLKVGLRNGYLNAKFGYRYRPVYRWGYIIMHLLPPPLRLEWDYHARHLAPPAAGRNRLLDVGCGNGDFHARAAKAGWSVTGVDFDPEAVRVSQSRGLEVIHGDIGDTDLAKESFDIIMLSHVIEHVHDPLAVLRHCYQLLRPGGLIWIATPNLKAMTHRIYRESWRGLEPPRHLSLFTANSLKFAVTKVGFDSPDIKSRGYPLLSLIEKSSAIKSGQYSENGCQLSRPKATILGLLELVCWLIPSVGDELIIMASKPRKPGNETLR